MWQCRGAQLKGTCSTTKQGNFLEHWMPVHSHWWLVRYVVSRAADRTCQAYYSTSPFCGGTVSELCLAEHWSTDDHRPARARRTLDHLGEQYIARGSVAASGIQGAKARPLHGHQEWLAVPVALLNLYPLSYVFSAPFFWWMWCASDDNTVSGSGQMGIS